ncbi:hypothetical protein PMZ80_000631 [Knufia obscura]|uniref:C2H2-type domain-containing protein n=1 Tax=Knufia obscura TaxID=1635080 RepID=A0ABR0S1X5_9EURO|nr:hypothetical protein PMZ80_000631 [Knufia obscura]
MASSRLPSPASSFFGFSTSGIVYDDESDIVTEPGLTSQDLHQHSSLRYLGVSQDPDRIVKSQDLHQPSSPVHSGAYQQSEGTRFRANTKHGSQTAQRLIHSSDRQSTTPQSSRKREKLYQCDHCINNGGKSFKTSNDLDRHNKTVHKILEDGDCYWICPVSGCPSAEKQWPRLDNFKAHVLRMHGQQCEPLIDGASHIYVAQKGDRGHMPTPQSTTKVDWDLHDSGISVSSAQSTTLTLVGKIFDDTNLSQSPPTVQVHRSTSPSRNKILLDSDGGTIFKRQRIRSPLRSSTPHQPEDIRASFEFLEVTPMNSSTKRVDPHPSSSPDTVESFRSDGERLFVGISADEEYDIDPTPLSSVEAYTAACLARLVLLSYHQLQAADRLPVRCHPGSGRSTASRRENSNSQPQMSQSVLQSRKRQRVENPLPRSGNDSEDEDLGDRQPTGQNTSTDDAPSRPDRKLFACPYYKRNAFKYSDLNTERQGCRACGVRLLRDISQVKQHLYRVHTRPKHYCPLCYTPFKSRDDADSHVQQMTCPRVLEDPFIDRMPDDIQDKLKMRKRGPSQEELWFEIFEILFPGVARPVSPYVNDQKSVLHFVNLFKASGSVAAQVMYQSAQAAQGGCILPDLTQAVLQEAYDIVLGWFMEHPSDLSQHTLSNDDPWHAAQLTNAESRSNTMTPSPILPNRSSGLRHRADSGIGTDSFPGSSILNHAASVAQPFVTPTHTRPQRFLSPGSGSQGGSTPGTNFFQATPRAALDIAPDNANMQAGINLVPDLTLFDYSNPTSNPYHQQFQDFF